MLNAWESVDTFHSTVYIDNLIRVIYNNQQRVVAITDSGKALLLEENSDGLDEYGNGVDMSIGVDAKAVTRVYRAKNPASIKSWKLASVSSTVKTTSSTKFRVQANAREPDSGTVELGEFTTSALEEDFRRLGVRSRGNGIQLTIDNGATPAGRWELRDVTVEGHESSRQRFNYA